MIEGTTFLRNLLSLELMKLTLECLHIISNIFSECLFMSKISLFHWEQKSEQLEVFIVRKIRQKKTKKQNLSLNKIWLPKLEWFQLFDVIIVKSQARSLV